ncbi:MAG TPA: DUF3048 domain-containing protein [Nocardioidaceae bacterium]|nr:DUF3048 domain-containing protein [Nocardioidaceae bacterium]
MPRSIPRTRHAVMTRPAVVGVALATLLALALAGCNDKAATPPPSAKSSGPSAQNTATGATMTRQSPLTGKTVTGPPPKHPIMIVKIDNTASSQPQIGLSKADLVTEELVEGGSTRLAAFYDSKVPKVVGPVRSMRATDIGVVEPAHAVLVASGGAPPTVRRVRAAHITTFTEGATGYYRESSRPAPYNLFMHLPKLAKTLHKEAKKLGTPPSYLPFGGEASFPKGQKAHGLDAKFSASHTTSWKYQHGTYTNLNSYAATGDRFHPDTILVMRVHEGDAGYLDPAGHHVPETDLKGKGDAIVFHHGRMVRATWVKKGLHMPIRLRTTAGSLKLPPGHVWIEMVPSNGGSVQVTK